MHSTTFRRDRRTVAVRGAGTDAYRGVLGEVVRVDVPRKRFEARIDKCCHGRFERQVDAAAHVAKMAVAIERGNALLAGWRP